MTKIFVTGAGGFIGSMLSHRLAQDGWNAAFLEHTRSINLPSGAIDTGRVEIVRADLLDPDSYAEALSSSDTVVHLAAATGKASREGHFMVNEKATDLLLRQCRLLGTRKFLFVSTIAVKFSDKSHYYYAQAKLAAEGHVKASGNPYLIVRPTIVMGNGSPVLSGLAKLADLPVMPVFGTGGILVQPIHVEDLAELILTVLKEDRFDGRTIEFGGPKVVSVEDLLLEIRQAHNRSRGSTIHVPMGLVLPLVKMAESLGLRFLPITAGQLATFRFDGVAEENSLTEKGRASLRPLEEMIQAGDQS